MSVTKVDFKTRTVLETSIEEAPNQGPPNSAEPLAAAISSLVSAVDGERSEGNYEELVEKILASLRADTGRNQEQTEEDWESFIQDSPETPQVLKMLLACGHFFTAPNFTSLSEMPEEESNALGLCSEFLAQYPPAMAFPIIDTVLPQKYQAHILKIDPLFCFNNSNGDGILLNEDLDELIGKIFEVDTEHLFQGQDPSEIHARNRTEQGVDTLSDKELVLLLQNYTGQYHQKPRYWMTLAGEIAKRAYGDLPKV